VVVLVLHLMRLLLVLPVGTHLLLALRLQKAQQEPVLILLSLMVEAVEGQQEAAQELVLALMVDLVEEEGVFQAMVLAGQVIHQPHLLRVEMERHRPLVKEIMAVMV
jgi:hypothetical protein